MKGANDQYRIRIGDYRVRYEIDDKELIILRTYAGALGVGIAQASHPRYSSCMSASNRQSDDVHQAQLLPISAE